jgi:hypothetical protein
MRLKGVRLTVRAYDENGYQRDILVQDEQQVRISDARLKGGLRGTIIDPAELPEMKRFEVILENVYE